MVLIISIVFAIVILSCCCVYMYLTRDKRALISQAKLLIPTALQDFNIVCNPGKLFTKDELTKYDETYAPLFEAIKKYGEKRFNLYYSEKCDNAIKDAASQFVSIYNSLYSRQKENNNLFNKISFCDTNSEILVNLIESKFSSSPIIEEYFTHSQCKAILDEYAILIESLNKLYPVYKKYFKNSSSGYLYNMLSELENRRLNFNHKIYVPKFLDLFSQYFSTILSYPLDEQQRKAIVTDEDNALVISSAGSGKTSTIIGKSRYLVDCHNVDPSKILIITYTRKAAQELRDRLGNIDVTASTFHALAMSIIAEATNHKPTLAPASLLLNSFKELLNDPQYIASLLNYVVNLHSLMGLEHDYADSYTYFADRKKYGIQAIYPDMDGHIIFTRSEEEKRICSYLTELGVRFRYEEKYEHNTYTKEYKQYKPDFSIYYDKEVRNPHTGEISYMTCRVYLEHFAINRDGQVPRWFGTNTPGGWEAANASYNAGIVWKRNLHKEKRTILVETTSADFHSGKDIKDILTTRLRAVGVPISPKNPNELYQIIIRRNRQLEKSVFRLFEQFITLLKSNCISLQSLITKATLEKDNRSVNILSSCIKPLLEKYSENLQERGELDYTDLIIQATNISKVQKVHEYDYILVDEFQDISTDRYKFLDSLRTSSPLTKLFCVGDDWQSIYRFAGSNMKLFYKFEDFFGFTERCKIETTYRFFEPLLSISSDFIQRNPEQMKKHVKAIDSNPPIPITSNSQTSYISIPQRGGSVVHAYPIEQIPEIHRWIENHTSKLEFVDCGIKENILPYVEQIINTIPKDKSIYILGRYTYDVECLGRILTPEDADRKSITVDICGRKISYLTVHSAKGLEADYVILINCNEGTHGFPSLIEDDPILSFVLSDEDTFEHGEERRLFYVALTRAKRKMFVLYNNDKPSPFVKELHEVLKTDESLCPFCQDGHIVVIKESISKNGSSYTLYGCSNAKAGCPYFERVFEGGTPNFVIFNRNYDRSGNNMNRT